MEENNQNTNPTRVEPETPTLPITEDTKIMQVAANNAVEPNSLSDTETVVPETLTEMPPMYQEVSTASTVASQNFEDIINVSTSTKNYKKILVASCVIFATCFAMTILAFLSTSYELVNSLSGIIFYGGILGALLLGIGMASYTIETSHHNNSTSKNIYKEIGIVFAISSIVFGIFTLIPGIILLIVGSKQIPGEVKKMPKAARIILAITAFLGAGISGLIVIFILSFAVADRACQLTSSKCY